VQNNPLILENESEFNTNNIEKLFDIFKNDFIDNKVILTIAGQNYTITTKPNQTCKCPFAMQEKSERFWHIITKKEFDTQKRNNPCPDDKEKNRVFCPARAKRIHWIKQTIENIGQEHIKYFCEINKQTTHFIWDTKRFYIVLVKELGKSQNLLVTAYPVHKNKYRDYKKRLKKYEEDN